MTPRDLAPPPDPMFTLGSELEWLKANPAFAERPASLEEFLGKDYLNIKDRVRRRILKELRVIFGEEVSGTRPTAYPLAMVTGGIGIGKTTIAAITLTYLCHWVLCLKNPQEFYNLMDGSHIAFMQMSTSEKQARQVIFSAIKARIKGSPWFTKNYPYDPSYKNEIHWDQKDIWIIPGDSSEKTFEGYNILGGVLDEADSHLLTPERDYAEEGYTTIYSRITSRFQNRGFLMVIGQMKSASGFAARKFEEFKARPDAYAVRLAIWEAMNPETYTCDTDGNPLTFAYDVKRKRIIPDAVANVLGNDDRVIRIPIDLKPDFLNGPEKALRDLAGIPPLVGDAFITITSKIDDARNRWIERNKPWPSPVDPKGKLADWFYATEGLRRTCHLDIAFSGEGDAYGFAMGHVRELKEVDSELKPYIVIDMLYRIKALPGSEVFLGDMRQLIYTLRDERNFRIKKVTMDGFESTDTRQQLERKRFQVDEVSIDKQLLPYYDLREALYENRIEFPPYLVEVRGADGISQEVEILYKELSNLVDMGRKIDHPVGGSKDVADAVAGVVVELMGDRRYRRGAVNPNAQQMATQPNEAPQPAWAVQHQHPAIRGDFSPRAPLPPTTMWRT